MKDLITLKRIELLHPSITGEVYKMYDKICDSLDSNTFCRFTHTLRTIDEQNRLYAKGRTIRGQIVTNARGGQSYHNYGLAIDIVLISEGKATWDRKKDFDQDGQADFMEVVKIFKEHGWEWGGDFKSFKDFPHFQKTFGYTTSQLFALPKIKNTYPIL